MLFTRIIESPLEDYVLFCYYFSGAKTFLLMDVMEKSLSRSLPILPVVGSMTDKATKRKVIVEPRNIISCGMLYCWLSCAS